MPEKGIMSLTYVTNRHCAIPGLRERLAEQVTAFPAAPLKRWRVGGEPAGVGRLFSAAPLRKC